MDAFSTATLTIHSQGTFKVKEESHVWCVANICNQTNIRTKIYDAKELCRFLHFPSDFLKKPKCTYPLMQSSCSASSYI